LDCCKTNHQRFPTCRVPLCLDCLCELFGVDRSKLYGPTKNKYVNCPICRKPSNKANDSFSLYLFNFEIMNIMDHYIEQFSKGDKLIYCDICELWFASLKKLLEHKFRGHCGNCKKKEFDSVEDECDCDTEEESEEESEERVIFTNSDGEPMDDEELSQKHQRYFQ
jgi:hypothetical protein